MCGKKGIKKWGIAKWIISHELGSSFSLNVTSYVQIVKPFIFTGIQRVINALFYKINYVRVINKWVI